MLVRSNTRYEIHGKMLKLTLILLAAILAEVYPRDCGESRTYRKIIKNASPPHNILEYRNLPWLVAIYQDGRYRCSGTLIHSRVILTAGHCLANKRGPSTVAVEAGAWNFMQTQNDDSNRQRRNVSTIIYHPNLDLSTGAYDYALAFLSQPFQITDSVDVVCLPASTAVFDGSMCLESRWDRILLGDQSSALLTSLTVEDLIMDLGACQRDMTRLSEDATAGLGRTSLCAKTQARSTSISPSGGSPLSCPSAEDPSRYVLAGILSRGYRNRDYPNVFAKAAVVVGWINEQIAGNPVSS